MAEAQSVWRGLIQVAGAGEKRPAGEPLAMLRAIRDAARGTGKLSPAAAAWLADGIDRYLAGNSHSFDECFGLKLPRGGRHQTPAAVSRKAKRDRAVFQLTAQLVGDAWSKAGMLHKIINGGAPVASKKAREVLGELAAQGITLPSTRPALYQAIVAVTLSNRDMKKSE